MSFETPPLTRQQDPLLPRTEPTQVPRGAAERADAVVREKLDQRALIRNIVERWEHLRAAGWQAAVDVDSGWPTIWKAGGAWGDEVDWSAHAGELVSLTSGWVELFPGLADSCRRIRAQCRQVT